MRRLLSILLLLSLAPAAGMAQELFIHNDPASVLPRDAVALRSISSFYREGDFLRYRQALRLGIGLAGNWQVSLESSVSNHNHPGLMGELFPSGGSNVYHQHQGGTEHHLDSVYLHPLRFNGLSITSQYRFFTQDGPNRHWRAAAYQTLSANLTTHHFAEPNLQHRTAGLAAGLVGTWLYKKFAASLKLGYVYALPYRERAGERAFRSGNAMEYALSLGYLAFPLRYKSYKQLNINVYAEFQGKWYGQARVREGDIWYYIAGLEETAGGRYLEFRPGLQFILSSRFRTDLSTALPLWGRSLAMEYPQFQVNFQYLFFR